MMKEVIEAAIQALEPHCPAETWISFRCWEYLEMYMAWVVDDIGDAYGVIMWDRDLEVVFVEKIGQGTWARLHGEEPFCNGVPSILVYQVLPLRGVAHDLKLDPHCPAFSMRTNEGQIRWYTFPNGVYADA